MIRSIRKALIEYYRLDPRNFEVHERGEHTVIILYSNARYTSILRGVETLGLTLALLRLPRSFTSRRMREILVFNSKWGSIDAMCILYARRNRTRLFCTGRPEAVEHVVEIVEPDIITTTPWSPERLTACRGKQFTVYYSTPERPVYSCLLHLPVFAYLSHILNGGDDRATYTLRDARNVWNAPDENRKGMGTR